jgi:hypothetical protein
MKRIEPGQVMTFITNVGVLGGLLLLAFELRQNNELMEAEARMHRTAMSVDAWRFFAENGDLVELREREKSGEELSSVETRRIDGSIMSIFVIVAWTFAELSEESSDLRQVREVQRYNFANSPEYRRVWEARKTTFDPAFVQWMEKNVVNQ